MKLLIAFFLVLTSLVGYAQTDTLTRVQYSYDPLSTNTVAWEFQLVDTVTVEDTLFLDGDTILSVKDTAIIILPSDFGNGFAGMLTVDTDSIVDALQGDVSIDLYQAVDDDSPYVFITGTDADHTSPPDTSHKFFQLRGTKLKIVYHAVSGTSRVHAWIVLKPSAISNNAAN